MATKSKSTSASSNVTTTQNKRSVIIHKTEKPIENLSGELAKIEETIQELCDMLAQIPESRHYGVGGKPNPTDKQKQVLKQLESTGKRSDQIIRRLIKSKEENLSGVLGKIEETVQELTRLLTALPEGRHIGIDRKPVLTTAQLSIRNELIKANKRADRINQIIFND
ncbi:MAG: hypothetical protein JW774_09635 [Candidatus Aureabacteria bacterium]|nr:hypothetical protein [Candidatus Auribacterota bacterium]